MSKELKWTNFSNFEFLPPNWCKNHPILAQTFVQVAETEKQTSNFATKSINHLCTSPIWNLHLHISIGSCTGEIAIQAFANMQCQFAYKQIYIHYCILFKFWTDYWHAFAGISVYLLCICSIYKYKYMQITILIPFNRYVDSTVFVKYCLHQSTQWRMANVLEWM